MKVFLMAILVLTTFATYAKDKKYNIDLNYYDSYVNDEEVDKDCIKRVDEVTKKANSVEKALGMAVNSISIEGLITMINYYGNPAFACTASITINDTKKKVVLDTVSKYTGENRKVNCEASLNTASSGKDVLLVYQNDYRSFLFKKTCKVYALKVVDKK